MKGERTEAYQSADGRRYVVCELCTARAEGLGWIRASVADEAFGRAPRPEPRRSLLGRLRKRAAPEPEQPAPADTGGTTSTTTLGAVGGGAVETIRVETVADASNAAARLLELASRNADELVEEAKDEADKIVGEARTKAERLASEAKVNADKMEADARGRAQSLDRETAERRTQLFGDLESERDRLSSDVDNLRAFEREYRSRLKTYFSQQLEALESSDSSDATPGSHDSGMTAPKRLRSVLGDDEG